MRSRRSDPSSSSRASPLAFFALVYVLSIPFWIAGARTELQLLPGLPLGALQAVTPLVAAAVLVYRAQGISGVTALLRRSADYSRIAAKRWYVPAVLLVPAMMVVTYEAMRVFRLPLPAPRFPLSAIPLMIVAFFVFAVAEELGWSGYATDQMLARFGTVLTGALIGLVWAAWHLIPLIQADRGAAWIAGWCLGTVGNRVLIVWLYDGAGRSVFAAALYHTTLNLSWQLFPNRGSHYDPRVSGVVIAIVAAAVAVLATARQTNRHQRRSVQTF